MKNSRRKSATVGIDRRGALECMIWAGTGVLCGRCRAACRNRSACLARRRPPSLERLHLPADQRQPCRLRQAGQSGRARHAAGGDRQGEGASRRPGLHDPHRRHHAPLQARPSSTMPAQVIGERRAARCIMCRASTTSSTRGQGKAYLDRYGKGTKGAGWYSFDDHGVHFIGLVNVVDLKAGGLGTARRRPAGLARRRSARQGRLDADRRLRAHPAVDRLRRIGDGAPTTAARR